METAGDEDRKNTSGKVLLAIDSNLGAVGCMSEEDCVSSRCISGIRKDGRREMKHCWKQL